MEIFELRYFLGVAKEENIHRASERLRVSPASLSKAVSRLEAELGTKLFLREGRHIRLTEAGHLLQARAGEMLLLEEAVKVEIGGHHSRLEVTVAGPEVLLSGIGLTLLDKVRKRFGQVAFELRASDEKSALRDVQGGTAHLALITGPPPTQLRSRKLAEVVFQTCVGTGHPLFARARAGKPVPIAEVLQHGFVSSHRALLGRVDPGQSADGWRDDAYPRRVDYVVSSLKLLEELVVGGKAIAYLPDYFVKRLPLEILKITDCAYVCRQTVRLVALGRQTGWINQLF